MVRGPGWYLKIRAVAPDIGLVDKVVAMHDGFFFIQILLPESVRS